VEDIFTTISNTGKQTSIKPMKTDETRELRSSKESSPALRQHPMALNPLEGLMSVAANHQLVSSSTAEPQRQQQRGPGGPASLGHRQSTRSSREPRKWVSLRTLAPWFSKTHFSELSRQGFFFYSF